MRMQGKRAGSHSDMMVTTHPSSCRKSHVLENYRVLLGNTQLYQHTRHTQKLPVSQIIVYPDFDKFHPFGNDIAMLQLLFPVNFTSHIIPSCLPAPGMQLPSNSSCWITGWGMLSEERPLLEPFRLQEGKVSLVENKFCNMLYEQRVGQGRNYSVHEEMLCAGDFSTGKAICCVSEAISVPPLRVLRASVSLGMGGVLPLLSLWRPPGRPASSLSVSSRGSSPWQRSPGCPFLSPLSLRALLAGPQTASVFEAYFTVLIEV
ncbi:putative serine protease 47 [Vicugna pacos]|uniref:Serine protease 47 n=1 Tax=Vicugna pacos TaxID=30538 RepID=A0ABM5CYW5_VICPA